MRRRFVEGRDGCPYLPAVEEVLTAEETRRHGRSFDAEFYRSALRYAQSLWREGKPAQALLQLNKAFLADLEGTEPVLSEWPLPYAAKSWILVHCPPGEFLGNPVRHYQHLATRMSGPRSELREWRAWACFHLAADLLPTAEFPCDERQLVREGTLVPSWTRVLGELERLGLPGESSLVAAVRSEASREGIDP